MISLSDNIFLLFVSNVLSESVQHVFDHCSHSMFNFRIFFVIYIAFDFWFEEITIVCSRFCVWRKKKTDIIAVYIAYQHIFWCLMRKWANEIELFNRFKCNKTFSSIFEPFKCCLFPSIFNFICFYSPFVVLIDCCHYIFFVFFFFFLLSCPQIDSR